MSDPSQYESGGESNIPGEELVANQILQAAVAASSEALSAFSGWLLGGIAAALAIILSSIDELLRFISVTEIKYATLGLLAALMLGMVAKYIGMVAVAGVTGG